MYKSTITQTPTYPRGRPPPPANRTAVARKAHDASPTDYATANCPTNDTNFVFFPLGGKKTMGHKKTRLMAGFFGEDAQERSIT